MNHVFVKLRLRGNKNKYRKVLSTQEEIYKNKSELVQLSYPYNAGAVIEQGEWFKIENFSSQSYALDIIHRYHDTVDFASFQMDEFQQIDFLFVNVDGDIYFQNVSKAKLIQKRILNFLNNGCIYLPNAKELVINEYPDAIYDHSTDILYFHKLEAVSSIFRGIDELYREATEEEVTEFLNRSFICLADGFNASKVNRLNRKRIALVADTLAQMDLPRVDMILSYMRDYCTALTFSDGKFKVSSDDDLKMILLGLEERFYTTPVSSEKRLANSVINLEQNNSR